MVSGINRAGDHKDPAPDIGHASHLDITGPYSARNV